LAKLGNRRVDSRLKFITFSLRHVFKFNDVGRIVAQLQSDKVAIARPDLAYLNQAL
jgi:hypothetical protein